MATVSRLDSILGPSSFRRPTVSTRAVLEHELRSMSTSPKQDTSVTLMMRVQEDPADPIAWDEFARQYQPMIHAWCLKWGSQPSDADDVAQQVLLKLLTAMKQFRSQEGSRFRGWLKTVTRNAWLDFVTSRQVSDPYPESINSLTDSSAAFDDLEQQMERAFEHELLELAMRRVEPRVKPATWEAFRLTAIDNLNGAEVARRLNMAVSNVFVHKHRVLKMLEEEVAILKENNRSERTP
jgi:RNA polymerase sigma factor (sigma-70 family)